ncbi:MAG: DUF167 domain-containing protein [Candidatus Berkelbacteria bacterium]
MKIKVKVKTNAREDLVELIDENEYLVKTKELPINGRANLAVIELLAEYFDKPKSLIQIDSGFGSKTKIIEVN